MYIKTALIREIFFCWKNEEKEFAKKISNFISFNNFIFLQDHLFIIVGGSEGGVGHFIIRYIDIFCQTSQTSKFQKEPKFSPPIIFPPTTSHSYILHIHKFHTYLYNHISKYKYYINRFFLVAGFSWLFVKNHFPSPYIVLIK
jgi:hypothetical protein